MDSENLKFKIGLSKSEGSEKNPHFTVKIGNDEFVNSFVTTTEIQYFEFSAVLHEGPTQLEIKFDNKNDLDTQFDSNGKIVSDLLLNVESVEIDDIDLGILVWTNSVYKPNYSVSYLKKLHNEGKSPDKEVSNCVNLGWNGTWVFPFASPFYIWLLENI